MTVLPQRVLTVEKHSVDERNDLFFIPAVCSGGTAPPRREFGLKEGAMLIGWDHRLRECSGGEESLVSVYRGAVRFDLEQIRRTVRGRDIVSINLKFQQSTEGGNHRGVSASESVGIHIDGTCGDRVEVAVDHWLDWPVGTHNFITGTGTPYFDLNKDLRTITMDGRIFRDWLSGTIANEGLVFVPAVEREAKNVSDNFFCLTILSDFVLEITVGEYR